MKGFYEEKGIYCTMFKVAKFSSKVIEAFMITDDVAIIANRINHREHFERAYAALSLDDAISALRKRVPARSLNRFGIDCEQQICLNQWYHKL